MVKTRLFLGSPPTREDFREADERVVLLKTLVAAVCVIRRLAASDLAHDYVDS